jgi:hypothetical protein
MNQNPDIFVYIVKYPICKDDTDEIINNIKYKSHVLIKFCERVIKWINFCLDNNIKSEEQYIYFNLRMDKYKRFFLNDFQTRDYWKQYRLNIPIDYIYNKINIGIEILFVNDKITISKK